MSVRGLSDLERGARRAPRRETVELLSEALHLSEAERSLLEAAARQRVTRAAGRNLSSPASSLPASPFVGRVQELALLDQMLTDGPPVLLVAGEPGIGKSRLLQAGSSAFPGRTSIAPAGGLSGYGRDRPGSADVPDS
jgi:hypothetical protein